MILIDNIYYIILMGNCGTKKIKNVLPLWVPQTKEEEAILRDLKVLSHREEIQMLNSNEKEICCVVCTCFYEYDTAGNVIRFDNKHTAHSRCLNHELTQQWIESVSKRVLSKV
jgi:hypothetical protein